MTETPPRTWGRQVDTADDITAFRNTPTHVGKTIAGRPAACLPRKHPHARGEDFCLHRPASSLNETPPRTWGRLRIPPCRGRRKRNTPTHVGKTLSFCVMVIGIVKHPHARGEDHPQILPEVIDTETPPRTWGRRRLRTARPPCQGNTPTHVGKTHAATMCHRGSGKHPHARGEDFHLPF